MGVDLEEVWNIVVVDLPALKERLMAIDPSLCSR